MVDYIINLSLGGLAAFFVWASLLNLAVGMGIDTLDKEGTLSMSSIFAVLAGVVMSIMAII